MRGPRPPTLQPGKFTTKRREAVELYGKLSAAPVGRERPGPDGGLQRRHGESRSGARRIGDPKPLCPAEGLHRDGGIRFRYESRYL